MSLSKYLILLLVIISGSLQAQIPTISGDTLYGQEWIEDGATYLKFDVTAEGFYRISNTELTQAGWSLSAENENRWQLWLRGQQVPVFVDEQGIYFFGDKNKGELDQYLFEDPEADQLNPEYSLYNDTATYFLGLTQEQGGISPARFVTTTNSTAGLSSESFIMRRAKEVYSNKAIKGFIRTSSGTSVFYSHYTEAEGYGSRSTGDLLSFEGTTVSPFTLDLPEYIDAGVLATISVRAGLGFDGHNQELVVEGQSLDNFQSFGWSVATLDGAFMPGGNTINGTLTGSGTSRDKASLAVIQVDYPAALSLNDGGFEFSLSAAANERRLTFDGITTGTYALFNLSTPSVQFSTSADFRINSSSEEQRFYVVKMDAFSPVSNPENLTLNNPLPQEAVNFLIVTSEQLRSDAGGNDPISEYADYRRSAIGGNHKVQVINVETLYNTHAYGLKRHPLAIRNYQAELRKLYPDLNYLFLIGKGREYHAMRTPEAFAAVQGTFFLPSFGRPASDNLISSDIGDLVPKLATGRLSIISAEEVSIYLRKVRSQEQQINLAQSLEEKDWLKQIIHLGGGGVVGEQNSIRELLGRMKDEIENNEFGGNVNSFFKTSTDPIEESREQAIFNRINEGTSIITFFGHSSSQGFDFNIDNPDNYNNTNRYPFMLSLGCYSGDSFTALRSIGERFILLPEKGAIAFGASKGLGYISMLGRFARKFYDLLGGELYGHSIGEVTRESINHFSGEGSFTIRILLEQFGLIGDPSIKIYPQPGPDLVFAPDATSFEPSVIPAQQDSFLVNLRLVNIGRGTNDSLSLNLRQRLPDGSIAELGQYRVNVIGYDNEVSLKIPNVGFSAIGENRLLATIDSRSEIAELPAPFAEENNTLLQGDQPGIPFFVVANTARPAFPPPYALHEGDENVELIAATTNPLAEEQLYHLQLDTSKSFAAPLATVAITQTGGLINWSPQISWQDSTVYYWRISPDSVYNEGQGFLWNASSFTYLQDNDIPGWAVAHQGQVNEGKITNIISESNQQVWNFARNKNDLRIRNFVFDPDDTPDWVWNGQEFASPWPWVTTNGIQLMILDSIRNRDWMRSDGSGAYNSVPHAGTKSPWSFDTRFEPARAGLMEFIEEGIPDGKYVTLYTSQRGGIDYGPSRWLADSSSLGRTIFDVLEAQGAEQVRQLINLGAVPYVFIFQKGVGPIGEVVAQDAESEADITVTLSENWHTGTWESQLVGPAADWQSVDINFKTRNITETDSVRLYLYGLTGPHATSVELKNEWLTLSEARNYNYDLSDISASEYPYLKLNLEVFDNLSRTSATLEQVYFHYTNTPDVTIDPAVAYDSGLDTLQQGEMLTFEVGYRNITQRNMDSLLVRLTANGAGGLREIEEIRQPPLAAGQTGTVRFSTTTENFRGDVQVQLQLNPDQDQPEQIVFNNDLLQEYFFNQDNTPPLLHLYFDGVSIRDGDLVSSRPEILIELRDENPNLLLNDSSAFTINLRYPDGSAEFIANGDERIEFLPATSTNDNRAKVYLKPELEQDGKYTISIQAGDRSGNASGRVELLRDFEVITEQRVSNVFNYPNPFTERTHFVYTLTGDVPPEVFRVQVMTVSGRVVYDVDLAQQEQLKIGTHQTDFAWDGTDTYGDKLANGVYLYRIITKDANGNALKQHDNGTDNFFKNRMGKLVILR